MVDKNSLICPKKTELTNAEKEVLDMITIKFYSLKQITLARKCSVQAVYKLLRNLKKKGYIGLGLQRSLNSGGTTLNLKNKVRLHGQEFNIGILWQDNRYQKEEAESNIRFIEGHTIKLYRNSIEVYAGEGVSFLGDNEQRADKKAMEYWTNLFLRLENELKIIIMKKDSKNVREVNHHYERGNSEICQNAKENKEIIRVYAVEDGKLAYWTDGSFGGDNDETGHPKTAKQDRGAIDKQVNDWRLNNPPTSSELSRFIAEVTQNQQIFAQNMVSHVSAIQELGRGVKKLTKVMKGVLSENIQLKLSNKHQTTLGAFS